MSRVDTLERLRQSPAARGLRMTPQRTALLDLLWRSRRHPTVEELHHQMRKVMPSVSLATVYRNVQQLARLGVIAPVESAGGAVRYDGNPDEHHHFVCRRCRRVVDIYISKLAYTVNEPRSGLNGAAVESCQIQLSGLCPDCRGA